MIGKSTLGLKVIFLMILEAHMSILVILKVIKSLSFKMIIHTCSYNNFANC